MCPHQHTLRAVLTAAALVLAPGSNAQTPSFRPPEPPVLTRADRPGPDAIYSNDPKVTHMLITIAKNPQTPIERRRRIIMILAGHSKDPEVIAFLEDLLKQ